LLKSEIRRTIENDIQAALVIRGFDYSQT
jgi:hypothetical protein